VLVAVSPSISVSQATKQAWDDCKDSSQTHDEFAQHALDCVARDQGEIVNVGELVDQIELQVASEIELAAYRGVTEALD
jgi:hypothetical protein